VDRYTTPQTRAVELIPTGKKERGRTRLKKNTKWVRQHYSVKQDNWDASKKHREWEKERR